MGASLETRFLAKIERLSNGCWMWTAATDAKGYAKLADGRGGWERAHRVAYRLFVGAIPADCELHHRCGVKSCVNPAHLEALTRRNHRRVHPPTRGFPAANAAKTHCPAGHPYAGENLRINSRGSRVCRTCDRDKAREAWRARHGKAPTT